MIPITVDGRWHDWNFSRSPEQAPLFGFSALSDPVPIFAAPLPNGVVSRRPRESAAAETIVANLGRVGSATGCRGGGESLIDD